MFDEQFDTTIIKKTTLVATTETTVAPESNRCRRYVIQNDGTTNIRWNLGSAASTTGGLLKPNAVLDLPLGRRQWEMRLYLREEGGANCDISGFCEEKFGEGRTDWPTYAFVGNVITPGLS